MTKKDNKKDNKNKKQEKAELETQSTTSTKAQTKNQPKTLDKLKIGKKAIISSVNSMDKALRSRILDMGLTPGADVEMIKTAPMGDPLEIRVRGYELTIRKADASNIEIKNLSESKETKEEVKQIFDEVVHSKKGEDNPEKPPQQKAKSKLLLGLIGNQNSGKTTLFNQLTGANQHVGNFPGVTVDRTDGVIRGHENTTITDLPGIYSLAPYTTEEIVTRRFILDERPDGIINIVDATNIERNLLLTLQLMELDVPMVIALNMMDEIAESGGTIDVNGLEAILGVPVIPISAAKNEGVDELIEHVINVAKYNEKPEQTDFCKYYDGKEGAVHRSIHSIMHLIEDHAKRAGIPPRFASSQVMEKDEIILEKLHLDKNELEACEHIVEQMESESEMDREAAIANMRFNFIKKLCDSFVSKPHKSNKYLLSANADKILTGKYTAIPSFLIIIATIFYITFGPIGSYLSGLIENLVTFLTAITNKGLTAYGLNPTFKSLITDGIFAGVGSVLTFLPMIVVLFFFLSILEDTGYMARVAFIMDKMLRKIGLSGRSFVPMLIGFGCSVPAIMAARTLPSERDRKMTIFLTPFMSCTAKVPIYTLFVAAFFVKNQVLVIMSLYGLGIIVGIILAYIMKFFIFKGEAVPFVMELPNYRFPSAKNIWRLIYTKSADFITRAFTVIFWATVVIWFLQTFDLKLNIVSDSSHSILAGLGNLLAPVFAPLGINDWKIATSFITGFMAKESVVGTLTVLIGGDVANLPNLFTPLTAFVFLVFCLLYTPCVAAIATVKKELGNLYAVLVVIAQCSIAWLVAFIVYQIGKML